MHTRLHRSAELIADGGEHIPIHERVAATSLKPFGVQFLGQRLTLRNRGTHGLADMRGM